MGSIPPLKKRSQATGIPSIKSPKQSKIDEMEFGLANLPIHCTKYP